MQHPISIDTRLKVPFLKLIGSRTDNGIFFLVLFWSSFLFAKIVTTEIVRNLVRDAAGQRADLDAPVSLYMTFLYGNYMAGHVRYYRIIVCRTANVDASGRTMR